MSPTHRFLKVIRTFHLYLGVFSAPMLIFFAITGGLQTFGLHESSSGSSYTPSAWLVSASQFHKNQTIVVRPRRERPASPVAGTESPAKVMDRAKVGQGAVPPKRNLVPMKIFFVVLALSLLISTLSGLYMAWRYSRKPRLIAAFFAGGILLPLLLLLV